MPAACPALPFLAESAALRLILFAGKGGVGKTTCAAATALGLAAAEPTQPFLLVSVDPAHSLRDAFADEPPPANLEVVELDAAACLAEFLDRHRETLREIARRGTFLDEQDVQRFVELSLPGMDELFAFLRIAAWSAAARYRTVIVDTAPSGHTHRLLAVPQLLGGFVQALHALLAKHRYLVEHYRGAYQPDHTDALLAELAEAAASTQRLLGSPHSCLVPVLLAESLSVAETGRFLAQLAEQRVRVGPLLVNRLRPPSDCPQCRLLQRLQSEALQRGATLLAGRELWGLPLLSAEVRGTSALQTLFTHARRLDQPVPPAPAPPELPPPPAHSGLPDPLGVAAPAPAKGFPRSSRVGQPGPPPPQRLVLFAGKGGVGKTTLASATALHLRAAGREVILLSTDPAHSLGDCLGVEIGAQRTLLLPGLWGVAPDAEAEWQSWRREYEAEVEALWRERLAQASLAFERQAMDRLLDLSPPGLDELVALTRVTELLAETPAATLVVDTAPTGHLLRLLGLPEVLDGWLKAIFAVLLKNRQAVRMPRLTDRLIELSKRLKALRALLTDPRQTALYAVAIPTWLAFAETADLLAACKQLRVYVARLWVNQLTGEPPPGCALCAALAAREEPVLRAYATTLAPLPLSTLAVQAPPLGLAALAELGQKLYLGEKGGKGDGLRS